MTPRILLLSRLKSKPKFVSRFSSQRKYGLGFCFGFIFFIYAPPPGPHSFPTRRSSDLDLLDAGLAAEVHHLHHFRVGQLAVGDRKSTCLNSSHSQISYAVFCLKKKIPTQIRIGILLWQ